eukprot:2913845-Prymnesium_polylepis.1
MHLESGSSLLLPGRILALISCGERQQQRCRLAVQLPCPRPVRQPECTRALLLLLQRLIQSRLVVATALLCVNVHVASRCASKPRTIRLYSLCAISHRSLSLFASLLLSFSPATTGAQPHTREVCSVAHAASPTLQRRTHSRRARAVWPARPESSCPPPPRARAQVPRCPACTPQTVRPTAPRVARAHWRPPRDRAQSSQYIAAGRVHPMEGRRQRAFQSASWTSARRGRHTRRQSRTPTWSAPPVPPEQWAPLVCCSTARLLPVGPPVSKRGRAVGCEHTGESAQ